MLQILRNKAQSTLIQAIVVIIALVFVFWGVGSNMMNNREAAITVNGEEISFQDFQIAYDRANQNLAAQFGGTLPKGLAESLGIKRQVVNQLVQTALLRQGATSMGVLVSEEEIQNTITGMVQFQEDGIFNMDKYESLVAANRMTPHKFETSMRHDMLSEKTVRDIARFAALASDYEIESLYQQDNEKVAVTYSKVSPELFIDDVVVEEEALKTWFETVKDNYRGESEVKLQYLDFSYSEVGSKTTVEDSQIEAYYNENLADFTTPEKRQARHILIKASPEDSDEIHKEKEEQARQILQVAQASDDFASVAQMYSEGPSKDNGGDLGFFSKGQMVKPFEDAVFTMEAGQLSDVVKTDFGYHIIRLEAIEEEKVSPIAEVRDSILDTLRQKEAQPLAFQLANSTYEAIIGAGSLKAFAEQNPAQQIIETDFFPRSAPPAKVMDADFLNTAFTLNKGELSSLIKTPLGYFILFSEGIKEPQPPELDAVRGEAVEEYVNEQSIKLAKDAAEKVLAQLKDGKSFAEATAADNLPIMDSGFMGRNSASSTDFPAMLLSEVFTLSPSSPIPEEVAESDGNYYVFSFKEREIPEVNEDTDLERYRQGLLSAKQQELLNAFISNLQKKAVVTVHQSLEI